MPNTSISIVALWFSAIAVVNAQIPRTVLQLPKEVTGIAKPQAAVQAALPEAPKVDSNNQNLTVAPVINPGNTTVNSSGQAGSPTGGGNTGGQGSETESAVADKLRNLEFDPAGDNVIDTKRGAVWNVFDNRMVDARFERYLNLDAAERKRQEVYLASLNQLLQLLCPKNPYRFSTTLTGPDRDSLGRSYNLLRTLGDNEFDHGVSTIIANEVDAANAAAANRKELYAEAEKLEKEIQHLEWNLGITIDRHTSDLGEDRDRARPGREANKAVNTTSASAPYVRKIAKAQALQAGKVAQAEAKLLLAKGDFQALQVQLFTQRRFQHVLIACAYYRSVFADGELQIKTEGKLKEVLSLSGAPLTVSTLESLTTEAIREGREGVNSVKNMMGTKRLQSAEKRLMETYSIGEHLPEMQTFPEDWRSTILSFRQARREAFKAIEVKDYTRAKEKNALLSEMASDYDHAPIHAAISSAESGSNLHLAKARNAAIAGDKATMEGEVKAAAVLWPQNPALAEGAGKMMERFDLQVQSLQELDRLLAASDLRGIEAKREVFSAAVATDEARQQQLRAALNQLLEIEKALERAKELDGRGSAAEAWVSVEGVSRQYPKDPKLLAAVSEYRSRAPEFVKSLLEARKAEGHGQAVCAINLYLLALKHNLACEEAQESATRLAHQQLSLLN